MKDHKLTSDEHLALWEEEIYQFGPGADLGLWIFLWATSVLGVLFLVFGLLLMA